MKKQSLVKLMLKTLAGDNDFFLGHNPFGHSPKFVRKLKLLDFCAIQIWHNSQINILIKFLKKRCSRCHFFENSTQKDIRNKKVAVWLSCLLNF
jgi:hypothetical protein